MKKDRKYLKIGYGTLAAILVVMFVLPGGNIVPFENTDAIEFGDIFTVFNIESAQADKPKTHNIEMSAEVLPNGQLGYQMVNYEIVSKNNTENITDRYSEFASIPGPTIIIDEGDQVFVTLTNNLGVSDECVSIHVHGVHYIPADDGTLQTVNGVEDSCATSDDTKTYHWSAAKGSAGVWPYHDHTFGGDLGSELEGLYGTLIVNPKKMEMLIDGKQKNIKVDAIDKDIVLWMHGTSFFGMEIDHNNNDKQTPLWLNPDIKAELGEKVRFNVIGIGSEFHSFHIHGHKWLDDGTTNVIDVKGIGPLTRTSFVIEAGEGVGPGNWMYHCHVFAHMEAGMRGIFEVTTDGSPSVPGPSPFDDIISFEITDEPGPWFKNRNPIPGTSESLAVAKPGDTIVFDMTSTNTVHTITSLLYPVDSAAAPNAVNMPFDQADAFKGGANVQLDDPGLYVFTCKVHPYMFAAVIVDDPATTDGLDLGENIRLVNGITVPTSSDLAIRLLTTFFVVTDPNNWQDYSTGVWNVSFPPVPVILDGGAVVPDLSALNVGPVALTEQIPAIPGVGEVWINTQFEETAGKTKYGSATAVDATTWKVTKKIALPEINMNHPHNMWTNTDQDVIYQTQWFDNRLTLFDRVNGGLLTDITVGDAPSHVMTNPVDGTLYIALNGDNSDSSVAIVNPDPNGDGDESDATTAGRVNIGDAHPHGHWISSDGANMVTPNAFTDTSSIYDFGSSSVDVEVVTSGHPGLPIATGMHPSGDKYYVANLIDSTLTCVSTGTDACVDGATLVHKKIINLLDGYDPIAGTIAPGTKGIGGLPIQTPVSPDGRYVATASLILPSVTIVDTTIDEVVSMVGCDAGCHGVQWGAKASTNGDASQYYAYVASKFSTVMIVIDPDPNGDGDASDATAVGRVLLDTSNATPDAIIDDTVVGKDGFGGQGTLAIPNVYDGWIENTVASGNLTPEVQAWIDSLTTEQQDPYS